MEENTKEVLIYCSTCLSIAAFMKIVAIFIQLQYPSYVAILIYTCSNCPFINSSSNHGQQQEIANSNKHCFIKDTLKAIDDFKNKRKSV